ncbi:MAG: class II aldolase/adducin family protein [Bacteroidales bacterium]|nr:class II aldolase/adducin family protein [Bacteroidales bacterium]
MITDKHIEEFVNMAHRVGDAGLTACSSGNLSWRIGDEVLVSGTGSWVPSIRPEQVAHLKLETGEVLNGVKPSMESVFHLGVLRNRPDQTSVLHFQSPYATIVACMKERPKNLNVTAELPLHVGEEIPEIPYLRPGSPELAQAVIDAMRDHNTIFLLKHGQVVCGKDFNQAFERATFLEMACRIAVVTGGAYDPLTDAQIEDALFTFFGTHSKRTK